jgi:uncharacterized delta-60 repeat protein
LSGFVRNLEARGVLKSAVRAVPKGISWALVTAMAVLIVGAMAAPADARRAGHLDPSFGHDGKVVVGEAHDFAAAVAIGRSSRIVVAGDHSVVRLRSNGHLDRSFADGGIATLDSGAYATRPSSVAAGPSSVALGATGAAYVAGSSCSDIEHCDFAVSRLKPDGELDNSFGNGGTARIASAKPYSWAEAIAKSRQGGLIVAGTSCIASSSCEFEIVRLNRFGDLDTSFGHGGRVTGSFGGCYYGLGGMALDSRGRIVVGGSCQLHIAQLARFHPNGSPDQAFGHGGTVRRHVFINNVDALTIGPQDGIDAAGPARKAFGAVRFGRHGTYDSSFGDHGKAKAKFPNADSRRVDAAAVDSRGRIIVAGAVQDEGSRSTFSFARFKRGGGVDRRFGHHGKIEVERGKGVQDAASVAIDRRDRIVGAGPHVRHGRKRFAAVRLLG